MKRCFLLSLLNQFCTSLSHLCLLMAICCVQGRIFPCDIFWKKSNKTTEFTKMENSMGWQKRVKRVKRVNTSKPWLSGDTFFLQNIATCLCHVTCALFQLFIQIKTAFFLWRTGWNVAVEKSTAFPHCLINSYTILQQEEENFAECPSTPTEKVYTIRFVLKLFLPPYHNPIRKRTKIPLF